MMISAATLILQQTGASRASARKKAVVAVARQLAIDLWRWSTGRATPQELGWIVEAGA